MQPDFLCLAKGLTSGYLPLATLTTQRVYDAFLGPPEDGRTFFHGNTYTGNPLGAAAALATLDIFERENIVAGLPAKTTYFAAGLERFRGRAHVGDIRRYGLCAGIELVADVETKKPFASRDRIGMKICQAVIARGVFLRPLGDVIVLVPPLSFEPTDFDRLFDALEGALDEVCPA